MVDGWSGVDLQSINSEKILHFCCKIKTSHKLYEQEAVEDVLFSETYRINHSEKLTDL